MARQPVAEWARMPDDYGVGTQGKPGERLPWAQVTEWLVASRNYWICTTRPDGRPHAVPRWGLWMDEAVIFSMGPRTVTERNLRTNSQAVIHTESGDEMAVCEGTIERFSDPDLLPRYVDDYEAKYDFRMDASDPNTPLYRLRPDVVLAWTEADFPNTATRWTFRDA